MTLSEVIKYLRENKKATVSSNSCSASKQNLSSLKYWIFTVKDNSYKDILKAKDWKVDEKTDI